MRRGRCSATWSMMCATSCPMGCSIGRSPIQKPWRRSHCCRAFPRRIWKRSWAGWARNTSRVFWTICRTPPRPGSSTSSWSKRSVQGGWRPMRRTCWVTAYSTGPSPMQRCPVSSICSPICRLRHRNNFSTIFIPQAVSGAWSPTRQPRIMLCISVPGSTVWGVARSRTDNENFFERSS